MNRSSPLDINGLINRAPDRLTGRQAFALVTKFGQLAPWLFKQEVLKRAADHLSDDESWAARVNPWRKPPALPHDSGACWVVAVHQQSARRPLLREAVVLPLRWLRGKASHDARLPEGLRRVAEEVLAILAECDEIDREDGWGLFPAIEGLFDGPGLDYLEGAYPSAWAPLAAGLILAAGKARPDPEVWASGCWKRTAGIQPIDGLKEKWNAALEFGARSFFVPEGNLAEAERLRQADEVASGVEIRPLAASTRKPREALRELLARFQLKPGRKPPEDELQRARWRDECSAYFLGRTDEEEAREFYFDTILPEVRRRLSERFPLPQVTHLATIVSEGFGLVDLAVGLFAPIERGSGAPRLEVLLLHDAQMEENAKKTEQRINSQATRLHCSARRWKFAQTTFAALADEFRTCLLQLLNGVPAERLAIDLTAGKRLFNLALFQAAPRGCHVFVCQADYDKDSRRQKPFTERIDCWRGGDRLG